MKTSLHAVAPLATIAPALNPKHLPTESVAGFEILDWKNDYIFRATYFGRRAGLFCLMKALCRRRDAQF